jgi:TetR/AcrR family transcriptional repressor of nem operon
MPNDARQVRRQQSHERILDAAARALYRKGAAGVGVAEVMRDAGLTHGGFYAHFESRESLLGEALEHGSRRSAEAMRERMQRRIEAGATPLRALLEEYLSETHMAVQDAGCPVAALGSDMARSADLLREVSMQKVDALIALVERMLAPGRPKAEAAVIAATMTGALLMARVLGPDGGPALLEACRDSLLSRYDESAGTA